MPSWTVTCFSCGTPHDYDRSIGRTDTCEECDSDLKVCLNCRFHDRSAPQECREPTAEYVSNKERANFCGAFEPSSENGPDAPKVDDARARLDALFKK